MSDKNTPSWVKKLVRERQAETGEKYTAALRAIKADPLIAEEISEYEKKRKLHLLDTVFNIGPNEMFPSERKTNERG